jgi:hypothetical protein
LNARDRGEIVFVRGATEAINPVAQTFGRQHVGPGDEVLVTELKYHAILVPWRQLCRGKDATLHAAPITDRGDPLALLQRHFSNRRAADVLAFDLSGFLELAGLNSNLSTGRFSGLAEMIKRLRGFAAACRSFNEWFDEMVAPDGP